MPRGGETGDGAFHGPTIRELTLKLGAPTRRLALIVAAGCGLAAGVALTALALLPLLVPAADLRRSAIEAVAGTTAQGVTITGEPVLQLLPSPRVILHKVTFSLPRDQALDAESVVSRINLWPLLLGHVEIADVTLVSPTLVLRRETVRPQLGMAGFLAAADAPELRVVNGTVVWRSESGLTQELVSGIDGSIDRMRNGRGVALDVTFDWRDEAVEASLAVDNIQDFLAGTQSPTRIALSSRSAIVRFRGQSSFGSSFGADGTISADVDSLRALLEWLGATAPTARGFEAFSLSSHLVMDDNQLSLTKAMLDLDGNRAEGGLLLKLTDARPMLQGTFAAERLNLNPYGRLRLTSDNGLEWSREPIDLSVLNAFDLDLRLSAGQVTAGDTLFTTVAASAVLSEGRLVLALGQTNGWNGMLRGTATLAPLWANRAGGTGLSLHVEADCTDIALAPALADLAGLDHFEGTGTLQFDLQGEGRSPQDIAQTLAGRVSLTSDGGYLVGFDVAQVLRRIERRPLAGGDPRGGRTAFDRLVARATLQYGLATLDEMKLSGKLVRLSLGGTLDVGTRSLDLTGEAALMAPPKGSLPDISLPFVMQGPWVSPRIIADPASLIERSDAAQSLLEAVKGHKSAITAVRSVIEKLVAPAAAPPAAPIATPAATPAAIPATPPAATPAAHAAPAD